MEWCRVYWGSHGCKRERGHTTGDHHCGCCTCPSSQSGDNGTFILHTAECVAYAPYYGPNTKFFGEDVLICTCSVDPMSPLYMDRAHCPVHKGEVKP